ncbi:MAG: hypothetical protein ACM3NV_06445 [Syntrophothermus sp.]
MAHRVRHLPLAMIAAVASLLALAPTAGAVVVLRDGQEGNPVARVKTATCRVRRHAGFFASARSTDGAYSVKVFVQHWKGKGRQYPLHAEAEDPLIVVEGPSGRFSNGFHFNPLPYADAVGKIGFADGGTKLRISGDLSNEGGSAGIVFLPGTLTCRWTS